ncbi:protocadherin gamma-A11-like isoform X29 [Lagopus muta]|uniref:protocadherin gamma-A11-like isoform X29 n=1 Tax=Lagopus muta TaxID=64668 RepID=UPI00209C8FCB|nr:protocadherin gamma-A11-like isoform X29 [Lagopus muta]
MGAVSAERGPAARAASSEGIAPRAPARMLRAGKAGWSLGLPRVFSFCLFLHSSSAQIRYSIPEELTRGAFVGNIAKDLGTDVGKLAAANLQQAQPNPDWRFSQTQRPGTSGSQNGEEGGAWPNNQFDTEMLQAMILASANEAADVNATLGGGTGTMGLSARYGPQFTLQHVPDYRQNVYIPGSTATLTNAAGKRDAKPSGGNKKKSGKKEKK